MVDIFDSWFETNVKIVWNLWNALGDKSWKWPSKMLHKRFSLGFYNFCPSKYNFSAYAVISSNIIGCLMTLHLSEINSVTYHSKIRPGSWYISDHLRRLLWFRCTEKPKPRIWDNSTQKPRVKKNIFGGHFDTYTKMIKKRRNDFLKRAQNVL